MTINAPLSCLKDLLKTNRGLTPHQLCLYQIANSKNSSHISPVSSENSIYLTPRNLGCSPGADVCVSIFSESMCAMEMTVAATYQGRPMKEQIIMRMATQKRSK